MLPRYVSLGPQHCVMQDSGLCVGNLVILQMLGWRGGKHLSALTKSTKAREWDVLSQGHLCSR